MFRDMETLFGELRALSFLEQLLEEIEKEEAAKEAEEKKTKMHEKKCTCNKKNESSEKKNDPQPLAISYQADRKNPLKIVTTLTWDDREVTSVATYNDNFSKEAGIALCYMKRKLGNKRYHELLKRCQEIPVTLAR